MKITRRVRWEDGIAMLSKHALFTAKQVFLLSVDLKFLLLNSGRDHPPRRGAVAGLTERHLRNLSFRLLFNKLLTRDSTISKDFILYHHVNRKISISPVNFISKEIFKRFRIWWSKNVLIYRFDLRSGSLRLSTRTGRNESRDAQDSVLEISSTLDVCK